MLLLIAFFYALRVQFWGKYKKWHEVKATISTDGIPIVYKHPCDV